MQDIENPMVIDSLWDKPDEMEREAREEERFCILADMEYDSRWDTWRR